MAEYKSHQEREHREQLGSFYDCGLCGQHFTRKDARDRHERTVHAEGARGRPSMQGQPRISPDLQPGTSGKFHLFIVMHVLISQVRIMNMNHSCLKNLTTI